MRKTAFIFIAIKFFCLFDLKAEWDSVSFPHQYLIPDKGDLFENVYSAQIPTVPLVWVKTAECNTSEPPSVHWKSGLISGVKGLSFKGLVFKSPEFKGQGDPLNSFGMFFHDKECYKDGTEYGWVFHEDTLPNGAFYVCERCNVVGSQRWAKWPKLKSDQTLEVLEGDARAFEKALENSGIYRYWNIQVLETGNFKLELVNPETYEKVTVTLKKPSWFSNCYNISGYITLVAKKQGKTSLFPSPVMHVDNVKIWQ